MRDYEEELIENQFEEYEDDDGWDDAMELQARDETITDVIHA